MFSLVANIHAKTKGELQSPIHYAAKYNAEDVIPVLMELGAALGDRDYKERTPMQLAAETGIIFFILRLYVTSVLTEIMLLKKGLKS